MGSACGAPRDPSKDKFDDPVNPTKEVGRTRRRPKAGKTQQRDPSVETSGSDAAAKKPRGKKGTKKPAKGARKVKKPKKRKSDPTKAHTDTEGSDANGVTPRQQAHDPVSTPLNGNTSKAIAKHLPLPYLINASRATDSRHNRLPGLFTIICNAATPVTPSGITFAVREPDGKVHAANWSAEDFRTKMAELAYKQEKAFAQGVCDAFSQGTPTIFRMNDGKLRLDVPISNSPVLMIHVGEIGSHTADMTHYFVAPFLKFFQEQMTAPHMPVHKDAAKVFEAERRRNKFAAQAEAVAPSGMNYIDQLYYVGGARSFNGHISYTAPYDPTGQKIHMDPHNAQRIQEWFHPGERGDATEEEHHAKLLQQVSGKDKELLVVLKDVDKWDFNVFELNNLTSNASLFYTAYALFTKYNIFDELKIDKKVFCNFLTTVQSGYRPNSYHNSTHAADVMHVTHYLLSPGGLKDLVHLQPMDILAILFAAVIHDYDHPGFNNNFHTKTSSYLATLYNDRSVLENHHCASVFEMMYDPEYDVFQGLSDEQRKEVRDNVIELVISTDMGNHARLTSSFKRRLNETESWDSKKEDMKLALVMAIKTADISNCARPTQLYLKWANNIAEEFYTQGDKEEQAGLPISPFMDRRKKETDLAKGQMSFINFIVMPLFQMMSELLPNLKFSVGHCEANRERWLNKEKDERK
eukprot:TRINITY_DN16020_c0_g1_i1.p1 TRINITY_DN16020_c0_g1~~TRINITY_DN16020_c0_g1_i1.p1  ORF type:complete len:693 (+),score=209.95 TRINITY_DN16020_c0_g1_i1:132-2210(+)